MDMGRPRKQPRTILTFNVNDATAERIDALRLSNRSEWANKVFKDYLDDRDETAETFEKRAQVIADPAARINDISTRRLAAVLLGRLTEDAPSDFKQLKTNLQNALKDGGKGPFRSE